MSDQTRPEADHPDGDDVDDLRNGDRAAVERVVRNNAGWMLAVARRIVRNEDHAEDAVQNAFASIFQGLAGFDGRSALRTWMHRIVVNEALMLHRRHKRLREEPIDPLLPVFDARGCRVGEDWATTETPERIVQQMQAADRVTGLIDRLPEPYRVVLVLRDIEALSTRDVGDLLGLSETNVKVRLHRARAALKKLLEPLIREHAL